MNLYLVLLLGIISFLVSYITLEKLKKVAESKDITERDMNKSKKPKRFHMAGIGIVTGIFITSMIAIGITVFTSNGLSLDLNSALAITITALALGFIGLVDDIFDIPQWIKAILPMFASIPLIALKTVGSTTVLIPFIGPIELGYFYLFIIIPFAISGTANLANIFAGINGIEAKLSLIMYLTALFFGLYLSKTHLLVFSMIMVGSLLAFLRFNTYPSKVFPGDVGTLVMGGVISSLAIVDNFESFVPFLFIPHMIDLLIKIKNRLPSKEWWFKEEGGYLLPPKKPISLLQYTVKNITGKIEERMLVNLFVVVELLIAIFVILINVRV